MNQSGNDAFGVDLTILGGRMFAFLGIDEVAFKFPAKFGQRDAAALRAIRHAAVPEMNSLQLFLLLTTGLNDWHAIFRARWRALAAEPSQPSRDVLLPAPLLPPGSFAKYVHSAKAFLPLLQLRAPGQHLLAQ